MRCAVLSGLCCSLIVMASGIQAAEPPAKVLPLKAETLQIAGCEAFVIPPSKPIESRPVPWVWYAPTLRGLPGTEEKWMFERLGRAGVAVAGIDVGESFGSPDGCEKYHALYQELIGKRGFARKPVLLGRSRGGLMVLNWAAQHPENVNGFAGIYPVCNLLSYPGLANASGAYDLTTEQLHARLKEFNPIDRLEGLAKAKVPLFSIHGDIDTVVPIEANSGEVAARYRQMGGKMELIVPKGQGHNMWSGFFECQELVDFLIVNAVR